VAALQTANASAPRKGVVAAKAVHWSDDLEPLEIAKTPVAAVVVLAVAVEVEVVEVPMNRDCHCCSDASVLEPLREHRSVLQIPAASSAAAAHREHDDVHSVEAELAL